MLTFTATSPDERERPCGTHLRHGRNDVEMVQGMDRLGWQLNLCTIRPSGLVTSSIQKRSHLEHSAGHAGSVEDQLIVCMYHVRDKYAITVEASLSRPIHSKVFKSEENPCPSPEPSLGVSTNSTNAPALGHRVDAVTA